MAAVDHHRKSEQVTENRQRQNVDRLFETKHPSNKSQPNQSAVKSQMAESLSQISLGEPIKYSKETAVVLHDQLVGNKLAVSSQEDRNEGLHCLFD